jgi:integrase
MLIDITEQAVMEYQNARLRENTAPKSVNEEVGFLLRILGEPGDLLRARKARSLHLYPAIMLSLNAGVRDAELKRLTWAQIDMQKRYLTVGRSKTEAGEGHTIPLNSALIEMLEEYREWYRSKFDDLRLEWYVFPFGKPHPADPTRPVTTFKTAWNNLRKNAQVVGRWHGQRHTLIPILRKRSGRSDDHGYRRSCLEADVETL